MSIPPLNDVQRARVQLGCSQEELARILGTTQSTISKWEGGKEPSEEWLLLRLRALGQALDQGALAVRAQIQAIYREVRSRMEERAAERTAGASD